jgi:hypothetical protein
MDGKNFPWQTEKQEKDAVVVDTVVVLFVEVGVACDYWSGSWVSVPWPESF